MHFIRLNPVNMRNALIASPVILPGQWKFGMLIVGEGTNFVNQF